MMAISMATHRRMTSRERELQSIVSCLGSFKIKTTKALSLPMACSVISPPTTHHHCSCIQEVHYNHTHSVPGTVPGYNLKESL